MASDLYRDASKDRDINTTNPRTRSTGGLTSTDNDYKNYLAGMKPRTKSQPNQNEKIHSSSFVDSAARVTHQSRPPRNTNNKNKVENGEPNTEETKKEQEKKSRLYAEFSAVPHKKSVEKNFQANDTQTRNNLKSQSNIDFSSLKHPQSDSTGSVGRLRSMFDKGGEAVSDSQNVVQLRNSSRAKRDRPYSASFDLSDKPTKPKVSGIYDRHSLHIQPPLEVDFLISKKKEPVAIPDETKTDTSKMDSSADNGVKNKIDINSLLAPEEPKKEKNNDDNSETDISAKKNQIDMQKKMVIDRMKRTEEEVLIEQKFNIKRRSLKERLSDLANGNETTPTYVPIESSLYTPTNEVTKTEDDSVNQTVEKSATPEIKPKSITSERDSTQDSTKDKQMTEKFPIPVNIKDEKQPPKRKDRNLPALPLINSNNVESLSPTSDPKSVPLKDPEDSMSEIDKYKSAVQRFDDFISSQEAPASNGKVKAGQEPVNNIKTDVNQNVLKLKHGDDQSRSSDTDYSQSENEGDGSDLMNSILNHMEKSKPENKDYFSLLRSSSREEGEGKSDQRKPDESPKPLLSPDAPEVLPRLSKLQGRLPTSPPPPYVPDETPTKELPALPLPTVYSPAVSSPAVSSPIPPLPQTYIESYDSRETSCCSGSSESEDMQDGPPFSIEEFSLPPPPPKSNLSKTKPDKKKNRVIFNDGKIEEVVFTYGPKEYNRANADIDPIASSAEWELEKRVDNMDIFSVDLQKDERGLGLSIIGLGVGTETGVEKLGIFVKTLTENGASQKDGRIQVNDQILEVNGVSLVGVTQFFAAQTLKGTNGVVRFLMGREKTRRTQFAPGAPILDNPDMKKHIEEMNKTMAQLEEYEQRALDAEHTLEDVKMELLKAEERAHEAEHGLKETKELLKAATESPFINGQRKLKNEIKKGGAKKNDKVDDLQRSLKDVTNRLSTSEENLLALTSEKNVKDQELSEFKIKLDERADREQKLSSENETLRNDVTKRNEHLESLKTENNHLKEQLKRLADDKEVEQQSVRNVAAEKKSPQEDEYKNKCDELERANGELQAQVSELQQRLQDTDRVLSEFTTSQQEDNKLGEIKEKLEVTEKQVEEKFAEVEELKGKNSYLESLVTKLNRRDTDATETDQYKQENERLKEKIRELEAKLAAPSPPNVLSLSIDHANSQNKEDIFPQLGFPEVPRREQVDFPVNHIIGIKPPLVSRDSKPLSPDRKSPTNFGGDQPPRSIPAELIVAEVPSSQPASPAVTVKSPEQMVLVANLRPETPDKMSDPNEPNPIPKPPRGILTSESDEEFVIVEKPFDPTALSTVRPTIDAKLTVDQNISSPGLVEPFVDLSTPPTTVMTPDLPATASETPSTPSPSSIEPPSAISNAPSVISEPTINADVKLPPIVVNLDKLQEDKVDSDEDEEKFQLIQEEIEDEKASLNSFSPRKNTDTTEDDGENGSDGSAFFDSRPGGDQSWLNEELKRLDREADLIAEQVALNSPVKRKVSRTASSSSEENDTSINNSVVTPLSDINSSNSNIETPDNNNESIEEGGVPKENRSHSIKIDMSYFKESVSSGSLDLGEQEDSVIDDVDKPDTTVNNGLIQKSLSFSAIPDTPTLNTKAALDKRQLANNRNDKRKPPTRGARGSLAGEVDEFQIKQSSLPRNLNHRVSDQPQISGAKSVPNLFSDRSAGSGENNKQEKQKHKFGFHLPKVFKKNKLTKKNSTGKMSNPSSPSVSNSKLPSTSSMGSSDHSPMPSPLPDLSASSAAHGSPGVTFKMPADELKAKFNNTEQQRSVTPVEGGVVPLDEKANAFNQEKVNDAATQEAVVPFAEKLMADNVSTDDSSEVSSSVRSASLNIDTPLRMEGANTAAPEDITLEISAPSSRNSSLDFERKGEQTSVSSNEPSTNSNSGQFNERPIDIGHVNGHGDEDGIDHWTGRPPSSWDVRQVGLWLVEMDLSQYVNNFKSHEVDGPALLTADGNRLKEYGVNNSEHRAEIKKKTKEFRHKLGKESFNKGKNKDTKKTKDKLQFWKGKYKLAH